MLTIVHNLENSALGDPERNAQAIKDSALYVLGFIGEGGIAAAEAEVETFAGALIEAVLADLRATATAKGRGSAAGGGGDESWLRSAELLPVRWT